MQRHHRCRRAQDGADSREALLRKRVCPKATRASALRTAISAQAKSGEQNSAEIERRGVVGLYRQGEALVHHAPGRGPNASPTMYETFSIPMLELRSRLRVASPTAANRAGQNAAAPRPSTRRTAMSASGSESRTTIRAAAAETKGAGDDQRLAADPVIRAPSPSRPSASASRNAPIMMPTCAPRLTPFAT